MEENDLSQIQQCPHDAQHPYVMVSRDLVRDESISPQCRWLIIYLLSNSPGWTIKIKQVINHLKGFPNCGRKCVYDLIDMAIAAGYMKREEYLVNNLTRYRYFVSEKPKFLKNSKNVSDVPAAGIPAAGIPADDTLKNKQSSKEERKNKDKKVDSLPPSAEAEDLFVFFLQKIKEKNPKLKDPIAKNWIKDMDLLLRVDNRDILETKALILWICENSFWKANCLSPEKLRKHFDLMTSQMQADYEKDLIRANRSYALKMKEEYPKELKNLTFDSKYVINTSSAKEIPFNLPTETFNEGLASMFGAAYD